MKLILNSLLSITLLLSLTSCDRPGSDHQPRKIYSWDHINGNKYYDRVERRYYYEHEDGKYRPEKPVKKKQNIKKSAPKKQSINNAINIMDSNKDSTTLGEKSVERGRDGQ